MQGDKPVRLFHYSYMPMAMSALPEPDMYFNNPYESKNGATEGDFYSEAKMVQAADADEGLGMRVFGTVISFRICGRGTSWMPTKARCRRQERLYPVSQFRTNRPYVRLRPENL